MFRLNSKSRSSRLCALVADDEGVALACVDHAKLEKPVLEYCAFHPLEGEQSLAALLKKTVAQYRLDKTRCSTLLAAQDYQLLLVEAPEVPAAELKAAIRWKVRDLIDFHIDDAVLDVFDVPPSGARNVQESLYVVVSRASVVEERAQLLQEAGVELSVIDIPELALRNLAARVPQDANGQALLHFGANHGLITLTRDATLYLARGMEFGWSQLLDSSALAERLALELQRSMDYYDRHFQQAPITQLTLCASPRGVGALTEQLLQLTGIEVQVLDIAGVVDIPAGIEEDELAHCLLAIGAALRCEPAQL